MAGTNSPPIVYTDDALMVQPDDFNAMVTYFQAQIAAISPTNGSFMATLTGVSGTVTRTATYTIVGNMVTLQMPQILGLSNATTCTITGVPVAIRPLRQTQFYKPGISSALLAEVRAEITTTGSIVLSNGLTAGNSSWVNDSQNKGLENVTFSYLLT